MSENQLNENQLNENQLSENGQAQRITRASFAGNMGFEVTLPGGEKTIATAVTLRDERVLERVHPRPKPPMKKPPNTGSTHPLKPDRDDPEYEAAISRWYDEDQLLRVGISLGYTVSGLDGNSVLGCWKDLIENDIKLKQWVGCVIIELEELVTAVWVGAYINNLEKESLGSKVDEAGRGNSSSPSQTSS